MSTSPLSVAQTTVNQMGGTQRLSLMIGARNFMADGNSLSFRFPNNGKIKANYCKVTLNYSDLYDMEIGYIHGENYKIVETTENIYADGLVNSFESKTGLYLSL
ncbi:hypothetical protein HYG89_04705 [Acinetobacter sp. SwsAc5]|uniref:hypothetical protein n=1 Tax=Acinetobacter sp. SwsAc5 TaxID=2749438 RepID=UPI0015B9AED5|nr:hypothetical protein [Acinetobacter sp. SwsAc5]NWK51865.1 hypothetical protein [Acinetobacter sp. SwsAc5]